MVTVKDGEYVCDILAVSHRFDEKNRRIIEMPLRVLEEPYAEAILNKRYYIVNQKVTDFLMREMKKIGLEIASGKEFLEKKDSIVGKQVRVTVATNETGSQSIYMKSACELPATLASATVDRFW